MTKRCPFVVLQECIESKCAVWRVTPDGVGYCGAGGVPSFGPADSATAPDASDPAAVSFDKQTTDGARMARHTRRPRS